MGKTDELTSVDLALGCEQEGGERGEEPVWGLENSHAVKTGDILPGGCELSWDLQWSGSGFV